MIPWDIIIPFAVAGAVIYWAFRPLGSPFNDGDDHRY